MLNAYEKQNLGNFRNYLYRPSSEPTDRIDYLLRRQGERSTAKDKGT